MHTQSIALCGNESTALFKRQAIRATISPMLDTLADRLRATLTKTGITKAQIARACGVTPQAVNGWLTTGRISKEALQRFSEATNTTTEWLVTGKQAPASAVAEPTPVYSGRKIPVISWVQAGDFCEAIDNFHPGDADEWRFCPHPGAGSRTFALRVEGESMVSPYPNQRSYPPGTIIFVDPDRALTNGARVVARVPGTNQVTFKRYIEEDGQIYLMPLNPSYKPIEITQETHICGVVIGSYNDE